MTEHEYNKQLERVDKYEKYNNILKCLERKAYAFSSGVFSIHCLEAEKIVEAYTEQINTIKKRMEEL